MITKLIALFVLLSASLTNADHMDAYILDKGEK